MSDPQMAETNPAAPDDALMNVLLTDLLGQWEELEDDSPEQAAFPGEYADAVAGPPAELFDTPPALVLDAASESDTQPDEAVEQTCSDPQADEVVASDPQPDAAVEQTCSDTQPGEAIASEPQPEEAVAPQEVSVSIAAEPAVDSQPQIPHEPTRRESLLRLLAAMYPEVAPRLTGQAVADAMKPEDRTGKSAFVVFHLGGESFGIALQNVLEADRLPQVTAVPFVPDFVRGVTNRRGEVLPLIDLRILLSLDPASGAQGEQGRMLVVRRKDNEAPTALVVDGLRGIAWMRRQPAQFLEGSIAGQVANLVTGAGQHRDTMVHILDVDRLFTSRQLV